VPRLTLVIEGVQCLP